MLVGVLLVGLLRAQSCETNVSAANDSERSQAAALTALWPRAPLTQWACIQTAWDDEDSLFRAGKEGYNEVVEALSDASEIHAIPGRRHEAEAMVRELVERWPQYAPTLKPYLAWALMQSNETLDEARQLLEDALSGWNRNVMAHNNLGVVLELQGRHDDAHDAYLFGIEAFNFACAMVPGCAQESAIIFANFGRGRLQAGDATTAARAYKMAARLALNTADCGNRGSGQRGQRGGTCTTATSRYFWCLALQALAAAAAARGLGEHESEQRALSRQWLLWSMREPGFRFPPVVELLTAADADWIRRQRFGAIFATKFWSPHAASRSGPGSNSDEITAGTRRVLGQVLEELGIRSILDVGCGDLHWIRNLDLSSVRYQGIDIVDALIAANTQAMQTAAEQCAGSAGAEAAAAQECARLPASFAFHVVDATRQIPRQLCLPASEAQAPGGGCELVMIKEVLIHLTLNDAVHVVQQVQGLAQAGYEEQRQERPKYLLAMHDASLPANNDVSVSSYALPGGGWRPVCVCVWVGVGVGVWVLVCVCLFAYMSVHACMYRGSVHTH